MLARLHCHVALPSFKAPHDAANRNVCILTKAPYPGRHFRVATLSGDADRAAPARSPAFVARISAANASAFTGTALDLAALHHDGAAVLADLAARDRPAGAPTR